MNRVPLGIVSFLALVLGFGTAASADVARPKLISGLGVTSSLTLHEVSFKKFVATARPAPRASFPATYSVTNFTGKAIPMLFDSTGDAQAQIEFRLLNEAGTVLWSTRPLLRPAGTSLPRSTAWRRTAQIPLVVEGQPLPAGRYAVEAEVLGRPRFLSQAEFEVTDPLPVVIGPGAGSRYARFYNVSTAEIAIDETIGRVDLMASGLVTTGGWSNPLLRPVAQLRPPGTPALPPADGIYEFELVALPPGPGSIVTQSLVGFTAALTFPLPAGFQGARIVSSTNKKVAEVGSGLIPSTVGIEELPPLGTHQFRITASASNSGSNYIDLVPVYRLSKPLLENLPGDLPARAAVSGVFDFRLAVNTYVFNAVGNSFVLFPTIPQTAQYILTEPTLRGVRVLGPNTAVVTMLPGE
jgi:hypothetical protein